MTRDTAASTARLTMFYAELSPSLDSMLSMMTAAGVDTERLQAKDLYMGVSRLSQPWMHAMIARVLQPGGLLLMREQTAPIPTTMFPQAPGPTSGGGFPLQEDLGLAMLDSYIETLANLEGRTGALVARRVAQS